MITHVLDSSAVLAHYLGESGTSRVSEILLIQGSAAVSVVSLVELKTRFDLVCVSADESRRAFTLYCDKLCIVIDANRAIADLAIHLREISPTRLPGIDSIIAATAKSLDAILVHRDPHFAGIPGSELKQIQLRGT